MKPPSKAEQLLNNEHFAYNVDYISPWLIHDGDQPQHMIPTYRRQLFENFNEKKEKKALLVTPKESIKRVHTEQIPIPNNRYSPSPRKFCHRCVRTGKNHVGPVFPEKKINNQSLIYQDFNPFRTASWKDQTEMIFVSRYGNKEKNEYLMAKKNSVPLNLNSIPAPGPVVLSLSQENSIAYKTLSAKLYQLKNRMNEYNNPQKHSCTKSEAKESSNIGKPIKTKSLFTKKREDEELIRKLKKRFGHLTVKTSENSTDFKGIKIMSGSKVYTSLHKNKRYQHQTQLSSSSIFL